jgi:UDP:flavonoid glycosyltransferase YjiC (YdhE family)
MPALLIGWELGAGIGHLHRMVPIVDAYLARGWTVTVAARHLAKAREIVSSAFADQDEPPSVVQAPIFLHHAPALPKPPASLAHLFGHIGFADPALCRPVIRAWRRLIDAVKPDLILSDFAPSLNVAANSEIPLFVIGNGWTIPPAGRLPAFREGFDPSVDEVGQIVVRTLQTASEGLWRGSDFCETLRRDIVFICTLPELDPYRQHREHEHYWPIEIPTPAARHANCGDVIVYLPGDHPALSLIAAAAARLPWHFQTYTGTSDHGSPHGFRRSVVPLDLATLLPKARLAIHHGGLGMANWCLSHRVPQAIFPMDLEKLLVGQGVEQAKAGALIAAQTPPDALSETWRQVADQPVPPHASEGMQTTSGAETLKALLYAADRATQLEAATS